MAELKIDATGLTINDLNDVFDFLSEQYKLIYGEDINIDQDTPDGQIISIYSKLNADAQAALLQIYNSFDPDTAVGVELNKIIKLSAITRQPATKSTVSVNVTASTTVTLPTDYILVDTLGQNWIIQESETINAGITSIEFEAVEWGSISANADTITEQGTILTEVTSVTNPLAASVGLDEETDVELRQRRNRSLEKPSFSTVGSLLTRLLEIDSVTDAIVYENATDIQDTERNIAPHTLWCIIEGGLNADITEIIAKEKTAGTGLKGTIEEDYTEEFKRANGTTRTHIHPVKFDRPTEVEIYIRLNVTCKEIGCTIDTDLIKEKLTGKTFTINEDLTITELYSFVYQAGSNFIATDLEASLDDITYVDTELDADYDEKFVITTAKITITEV
jgi:uncharacterized phage protein gp47/JayE